MDKRLEETKIKMIMRLRKVSRTEAERIVNSGDAPEEGSQNSKEGKTEKPSGGFTTSDILDDGEQLMTAEEFFGKV